jgi:hypothetical protein
MTLSEGIRQFQTEIAAAEGADYPTKVFDVMVDRADKRLGGVLSRRVVDAAGALAVIDLVLNDHMLLEHARFGERLETRLLEARNFFAAWGEGTRRTPRLK